MARVIAALIRHADYQQLADTPSAHQPFPLTRAGEVQARDAATVLAQMADEHGWTLSPAIDSSQLLRAWQTASIIADGLADHLTQAAQLRGFDELAERGLGSANNLTIQQIERVIRVDPRFDALPADWKSNSRFRLPLQGAESLLQAGERVATHLNRRMDALAQDAEVDTLKLFVGHGAAFRHAAFALGVLNYEQIAQLSMHHARPVCLEYLPGGQWRHVAGDWKLRTAKRHYTD